MPNSPEHCLFLIQALELLAPLVMVFEIWPYWWSSHLNFWIREVSCIWALCIQMLRQALCKAQLFVLGQGRSCLKQNSRTFHLIHKQLTVSPWPHTIPLRHRTQQWPQPGGFDGRMLNLFTGQSCYGQTAKPDVSKALSQHLWCERT